MNSPLKKKIIIIGPAYPYRGGPSTFVSYIYQAVKVEFDVTIYNYKLLYPSFLFPGTTQYDRSVDKKFIVPSIRIINSINPFNWFYTASRIKKADADLIIFDWWHPFFGLCHFTISMLIKKRQKGKILFITENFVSHEQNKIDKLLTRLGLRNADSFLALSHTVEKELKLNFPNKKIYRSELPSFDLYSEVEGFSRDNERKDLGLEPDDKVLLFFGYVRKYKGLDVIIEAMPYILKYIPDIKLLIAGEFYDDISSYSELIKKLNIEKEVILRNEFIPNEKVGKYFTASDLVVLPYRSATQSAVLNVSYSFNKPAIVTDVGGLSEFVLDKQTGIIVKPGDPKALSEGVKDFFELRDNINFDENIRQFRNKNKFQNLSEIFSTIINEAAV